MEIETTVKGMIEENNTLPNKKHQTSPNQTSDIKKL